MATTLIEHISNIKPEREGESAHWFRIGVSGKTEDEIVVGWCHDLLEDGYVTEADLTEWGVNSLQLKAIKLLTRRKDGQTYQEYIDSIAQAWYDGLEAARIAVPVKVYDLYDHLHPHRLNWADGRKLTRSHRDRYIHSLAQLTELYR